VEQHGITIHFPQLKYRVPGAPEFARHQEEEVFRFEIPVADQTLMPWSLEVAGCSKKCHSMEMKFEMTNPSIPIRQKNRVIRKPQLKQC